MTATDKTFDADIQMLGLLSQVDDPENVTQEQVDAFAREYQRVMTGLCDETMLTGDFKAKALALRVILHRFLRELGEEPPTEGRA